MFQFYGANRTGRWAGRLIQMQNLPQNHLEDLAEARSLVRCGDFEALEMLYEDVPDTLSQLIRTAFVPRSGSKFIVSDFSAIEARVIAWLAGEQWRQDVFAQGGDIYCASASQMFKVPVEKHGINGHLRQKGKIAELALGYGGSVGALKAMGALDMGLDEDELPLLVDAWRQANPRIVKFWWDVDKAAMEAVRYKRTNSTHGIAFSCQSGMLFITLPSGRRLTYVKPRIGENKFGGQCITYEGVDGTKKWERLDSYGPKFVENVVQATARDILSYAMQTLRCCSIVDSYGGLAAHGGGAFSGKDPTKVDRSGAYMARAIAKNIISCGYAKRCQVAISYAIGKADPVAVEIDTFGTGTFSDETLRKAVLEVFNLRPGAIIETLSLRDAIYADTATYGHFSGTISRWEWLDRYNELREAVKKHAY
jgi:hypothetical protein